MFCPRWPAGRTPQSLCVRLEGTSSFFLSPSQGWPDESWAMGIKCKLQSQPLSLRVIWLHPQLPWPCILNMDFPLVVQGPAIGSADIWSLWEMRHLVPTPGKSLHLTALPGLPAHIKV